MNLRWDGSLLSPVMRRDGVVMRGLRDQRKTVMCSGAGYGTRRVRLSLA